MTSGQSVHVQYSKAQSLVKEKEEIEKKIQDYESVLRSHKVGMKTPLVDHEGFPRADIDIFAIRHARAALLPLYNDLKYKMDEIHDALANLHLQSKNDPGIITSPKELIPFAKISGVAPDSPADEAGLLRGDLVIEFDDINSNTKEPLKKMAAEIGGLEFKAIRVIVQRDGQRLSLRVTPKPWNGRGLLGSHLVPI